jgi:dolichol-phosphate mannosyltransferase
MQVTLEGNLREMERGRELYWRRQSRIAPFKLRWRALTVRHSFQVLPGESILELGAGSGLWTEHLASVLRGENPITAAVFSDEFIAEHRDIKNTKFVKINDLSDLPAETYDYVIGTAILCHDMYPQNLQVILRLLKPGGQLLFFEANYWNPQVWLKSVIPALGRWAGNASCQVALRKYRLLRIASQQGFVDVDIIPYDIIHPLTPRFLLSSLQSLAFVMEHTPVVKELCGTLYVWAKKPGDAEARRPNVCLAEHAELERAISIVVPCHNEEMNIRRLVATLTQFYGPYIHEIIIVNDNSKDRTAEVTREVAATNPRVKLLDRKPPNGVGRALRDGYAAATGRYILTMDCDFVQIVPEFRDLFDAIAAGHDGAIGSRFSNDSLLINYPFGKILCNRAFHMLANLLLPARMRDISNNLKVYRAEILKNLIIDQPHFAANVETGLKPLLAGYGVVEVPISWINRTSDMGTSSFRIVKVAPDYFTALLRMVWRCRRGKREFVREAQASAGLAGPDRLTDR